MTSCPLSCCKNCRGNELSNELCVSKQKYQEKKYFTFDDDYSFWLIKMAGCQKLSQGSFWAHLIREQGDLSNDWQPLQRKEFQSRLCACKAFPPSHFLSYLFKTHTHTQAKKTKMWGPVPLCKKWASGPVFLFSILTFAVMAHPPVAVLAFALVWAWRVVAGGGAAAVALT